jgi:4-amino-4-deoxy-L-arabinose transferase-like glycosyltransferase
MRSEAVQPSLPRAVAVVAFAGVGIVYFAGLFVDVMDVDAAEYSHLAREMLEGHSFLEVKNRGDDYLDKPPLVFWLGAATYALIGVSTFAYKLPSLLFAVLGIYSTFRLTRLFAGERAGIVAALVLASCQAMFMMVNDPRTDTVLMGAVAFALWKVAEFDRERRLHSALLAGVGVGVAMLAKGPIGLMVPVLALASDVILRRQWRRLLDRRWLLVLTVAAVLLAPMVYGLYEQFGARGPAFFFWTQSFGRITGSNAWRDATTPLFFTHTLLWVFLPWSPVFLAGLADRVAVVSRGRGRLALDEEGFSLGGFALPFAALSLSQYKLPHYLYVILPLAAVMTGSYVVHRLVPPAAKPLRSLIAVQAIVALVLAGAGVVIAAWVFPISNRVLASVCAVLVAGAALAYARAPTPLLRLLAPSFGATLALNLMINAHFYPTLLRYQSPTLAARIFTAQKQPGDRVFFYRKLAYSFDFYAKRPVRDLKSPDAVLEEARRGPVWIYTDAEGEGELRALPVVIDHESALPHFHVTRLEFRFLNPATRAAAVERRYLLRLRAKQG